MSVWDSTCKHTFKTFEEYRKHVKSSTHIIEGAREKINAILSDMEQQIWMLEKAEADQ